MPLLRLETSVPVVPEKKEKLALALSRILSEATGKPEAYTMVTINAAVTGSMGGKVAPLAYADVRGIGGLTQKVNAAVSREVAALLNKELNLAPDHVYLTFTDVAATNWGWKGATFG